MATAKEAYDNKKKINIMEQLQMIQNFIKNSGEKIHSSTWIFFR